MPSTGRCRNIATVIVLQLFNAGHAKIVESVIPRGDAAWTYLSHFVFDQTKTGGCWRGGCSMIDPSPPAGNPNQTKTGGCLRGGCSMIDPSPPAGRLYTPFEQIKQHEGGVAHFTIDFSERRWHRDPTWYRTKAIAVPENVLENMYVLVYQGGWENWKQVNVDTMPCGEKIAWARKNGLAISLAADDAHTLKWRGLNVTSNHGAGIHQAALFGGANPLFPGWWRWDKFREKAETLLYFNAQRPHSFFFAFAWCMPAQFLPGGEEITNDGEELWRVPSKSSASGYIGEIKYRLEMRNMHKEDGYSLSQYGANEYALLPLASIGFAWATVQEIFLCITCCALAFKMKLHRVVGFLAMACTFQLIGMILLLAQQLRYMKEGDTKTFTLTLISQLCTGAADTTTLFVIALVAKGYAITRRKLSAATWKKISVFIAIYSCTQISLFIWAKFGYSEADAVYYLQAPPGIVLVLLRIAAAPWVIYATVTSLKKKRKKRFFIGFAVCAVFWILLFPTSYAACWLVPDYTRESLMLGYELVIAFSAQTTLLLLVFPLWPDVVCECCGHRFGLGCFPFHKTTWEILDPLRKPKRERDEALIGRSEEELMRAAMAARRDVDAHVIRDENQKLGGDVSIHLRRSSGGGVLGEGVDLRKWTDLKTNVALQNEEASGSASRSAIPAADSFELGRANTIVAAAPKGASAAGNESAEESGSTTAVQILQKASAPFRYTLKYVRAQSRSNQVPLGSEARLRAAAVANRASGRSERLNRGDRHLPTGRYAHRDDGDDDGDDDEDATDEDGDQTEDGEGEGDESDAVEEIEREAGETEAAWITRRDDWQRTVAEANSAHAKSKSKENDSNSSSRTRRLSKVGDMLTQQISTRRSTEPPPKSATQKAAERQASVQLREARRYAMRLQLRCNTMVECAKAIMSSLDELTIPDAGGDAWYSYVDARSAFAEEKDEEEQVGRGGTDDGATDYRGVRRYRQHDDRHRTAQSRLHFPETGSGLTAASSSRATRSSNAGTTLEMPTILPGNYPRPSRDVADLSDTPLHSPLETGESDSSERRRRATRSRGKRTTAADEGQAKESQRSLETGSTTHLGGNDGPSNNANDSNDGGEFASFRDSRREPVVERRIERIMRERKERLAREEGAAANGKGRVGDDDDDGDAPTPFEHNDEEASTRRRRDRRGSRSPQETTPSRPHSKGAGTDTRADSSPTESSIPSDDSAALESDDHWMDQTSSDDSHGDGQQCKEGKRGSGGGSNAKKGSVSKAPAHAAAARDDEQHSWDASDDLL